MNMKINKKRYVSTKRGGKITRENDRRKRKLVNKYLTPKKVILRKVK